MRAYKTVVWDGQEYSVPAEMKYLTVDSDGEVNVWADKPLVHNYTSACVTGFWRAAVQDSNRLSISAGHNSCVDWKESLVKI